MTKTLGLLGLCILANSMIGSGCGPANTAGVAGSGTPASETREPGAFTQIDFFGAGRVNVTIGQTQTFEISGDDNILPLIETAVADGKLTIKPRSTISPKVPLVITATVTDLTAVHLGGAGDVSVDGVSNAALQVELTGAGDVALHGQTDDLKLALAGAGNVDASDLSAKNVTVTLSGAGNAKVRAVETLNATIAGIGSVTYSGQPQVTQRIAGLGKLIHRE